MLRLSLKSRSSFGKQKKVWRLFLTQAKDWATLSKFWPARRSQTAWWPLSIGAKSSKPSRTLLLRLRRSRSRSSMLTAALWSFWERRRWARTSWRRATRDTSLFLGSRRTQQASRETFVAKRAIRRCTLRPDPMSIGDARSVRSRSLMVSMATVKTVTRSNSFGES